MAGKYSPLEKYLRDIPPKQKEVSMSFEEIEGILKSALPSSAYEDNRWWEHETEGNHVNKRAWANAGWKVSKLNVKTRWVEFTRLH